MSTFGHWNLLCMILYISVQQLTCQSFIQTAHLKPSSITTLSGISLATSSSVNIINNKWHIDVSTQYGSDMFISLDNRWGFHPLYPSSLQLYIEGNTSNQTYYDDGEILFVFAVDNEYFAEMVSLDKRRTSYKECPNSHRNLIQRNINEMMNNIEPDRYHRLCNNSINTQRNEANDYWHNVGSVHKLPSKWPMLLTIINNPIENTINYSWTDSFNAINIHKVNSFYTSSFKSNNGANIYISGESPNEDFHIFSIDITYSYKIFTKSPTNNPTLYPTFIPTILPTLNPTYNPIYNPTLNPTFNPSQIYKYTNNPSTLEPTIEPTLEPTLEPTNNPTTIAIQPIATINNVITRNSTKIIVLLNENKINNKISWFQILVIILSIFVFFIGWLAFFGFVYFTKRKIKNKESNITPNNNNNNSNNNSNNNENENISILSNIENSKTSPNYKSESAMIADGKMEINGINGMDTNHNINNHTIISSINQPSTPNNSHLQSQINSETSVLNNNYLNILNNNNNSDFDTDTTDETDETDETDDDTSETDEFIYKPDNNNGPKYKPFINNSSISNLHLKHSLRQQQLYKHQKSCSNHSILSITSLMAKEKETDKNKNNYQESVYSIDI